MNKKTKILIFGSKSIITKEIINFKTLNIILKIIPSKSINFHSKHKICKIIEKFNPNFVINNIAITNFNFCEREKKVAYLINTNFPYFLSSISYKYDFYLIHFSSSSIFEMNKNNNPFTILESPLPKSIYAKSKLLSEKKIQNFEKTIIIRLSVLYSRFLKKDFIYKCYKSLLSEKIIEVAKDSYFSPTNTYDLVNFIILKVIKKPLYYSKKKIIHFSPNNHLSRYKFIRIIEKKIGKCNLVIGVLRSKLNVKIQYNVSLKSNVRFKFLNLKKYIIQK